MEGQYYLIYHNRWKIVPILKGNSFQEEYTETMKQLNNNCNRTITLGVEMERNIHEGGGKKVRDCGAAEALAAVPRNIRSAGIVPPATRVGF